jgi:hypothetical protein
MLTDPSGRRIELVPPPAAETEPLRIQLIQGKYVTVADAASAMGLRKHTVFQYIASGIIPRSYVNCKPVIEWRVIEKLVAARKDKSYPKGFFNKAKPRTNLLAE